MTGQHEPDSNRFETWADGRTPAHQEPPTHASADESATWSPSDPNQEAAGFSATAPPPWTPQSQPSAAPFSGSPSSFPTYPAAAEQAPVDEAYAAFQGYQASTNYQHQQVQPYQGPYSVPRMGASVPNAPMATPSLILGILSMFCGGITGPVGLGMGIAALKQIDAQAGRLGGRGIAIAGIVTSAVGSLFMLMWLLGLMAF